MTQLLSKYLGILTCCLLLASNCVMADENTSYEVHPLRFFNKVIMFVPKSDEVDRLYVTSSFDRHVVKAVAMIDEKTLVKAFGASQTSSMPTELVQGYGKRYTEVSAFPVEPLRFAKTSIVFAYYLDNGREKRILIKGKQLQEILDDLH